MKVATPILSGGSPDARMQRAGSIGPLWPLPYVETIDFFGAQNFTHLDTLLMSMSGVYSSLASLFNSESLANIAVSAPALDAHLPNIKLRIDTLRRFADSGATLIVIVDHFKMSELSVNNRGTVSRAPLTFLNPLELPETEAFKGNKVEYLGPLCNADDVLSKMPYAYTFAFRGDSLITLFKAPSRLESEKKIVGAYRRLGTGIIIYAPPISDAASFPKYCSSLIDLAEIIMKEGVSTDMPLWAAQYNLKREAEKRRRVAQHKSEAERQHQIAAQIEDELSECEWHGQLIASSGKPLERAVRQALEEMGIPCDEGPKDRADFIAVWEGVVLVGEVKGYDGAAKEAALPQCKRWVSEVESVFLTPSPEWDATQKDYAAVLRRLGVRVSEVGGTPPHIKGIIVSNNYRNCQPNERPDLTSRLGENFSDILRSNLKRSEMVAITSLQLLGMMNAARENPQQINDCVRELVATDGVYVGFSEISEFLISTG